MSDFTKTKIGFAIALLAALFTVSPVTSEFGSLGYSIFGVRAEVKHLYYFLSVFLVLAVYFYSIQFLTERPVRIANILADISYAIAIVSPALYVCLFLVVLFTDAITPVLTSENAQSIIKVVLSAASGAISVLAGNRIRQVFAKREKQSAAQQFEKRSLSLLDRAKRLFDDEHYDLCVIECFRSIEIAARNALLQKGINLEKKSTIDLIQFAENKGIIREERLQLVHNIRRQRNIAAHGVESITRENALVVLEGTRRVLASMLVDDRSNFIYERGFDDGPWYEGEEDDSNRK